MMSTHILGYVWIHIDVYCDKFSCERKFKDVGLQRVRSLTMITSTPQVHLTGPECYIKDLSKFPTIGHTQQQPKQQQKRLYKTTTTTIITDSWIVMRSHACLRVCFGMLLFWNFPASALSILQHTAEVKNPRGEAIIDRLKCNLYAFSRMVCVCVWATSKWIELICANSTPNWLNTHNGWYDPTTPKKNSAVWNRTAI